MELQQILKSTGKLVKKHSPEILTGIGVAGMVATTIMAVKATPKAILLINEREADLHVEKLTKKEVVETVWKCYVPAIFTGAASIACIVGASSINVRRNAALATAYTITETALKEYKEKVIETVGEKKAEEVKAAIAQDKIDKNPAKETEIVETGDGMTLCYDAISGRYFRSDINKIKRAENEVNKQLLNDGSISLNDFYYEIGLENIKLGEQLGWDTRHGLIDLSFSSALAKEGTPCLVIDFNVAPVYDYYH